MPGHASSAPRSSNRPTQLAGTVAWVALGLLWLGALGSWLLLGDAAALEMPIYLTVIALVLCSPQVREQMVAMGWWRMVAVGAFVLGLLFAQVSHEERRFYPLATWRMYSKSPGLEANYRELVVVKAGGVTHRVPMSSVIPFRTGLPFYTRLMQIEGNHELLIQTIQALMMGHPLLEEAEWMEWRHWIVSIDERPIRPEQLVEETIVIPIP